MEITVTSEAQRFFKDEMLLENGDAVRFMSKVYGKTQVHEGFSVALSVEAPDKAIASCEENGILYYIDDADQWFFNGYNFEVDFNAEDETFIYNFLKEEQN